MGFKFGQVGNQLTGIDEIYQSLKLLLLTESRTLPGDPEFGTNVANYLTNPEENKAIIVAGVFETITRYEPRVKVSAVEVSSSGRVTIKIEGMGEVFFEFP
jgi:phage baseplate assembly protein W